MIYDKRKLKRYDIFLIVEFKPLRSQGGFSIGITRDLSPDGFNLEAQTIECQSGDIMEFRLKPPDAKWTVDIAGEVIWKNHSWYKYIIGIKFLKVNEEQNTKILKLMSAVRDAENKPELPGKDTENLLETEKEKIPEVILGAKAIDDPLPDTRITNTDRITLKDAEHCDLTDSERTFITGDIVGTSKDNDKEDINMPEVTDDSEKRFKETLLKDIDLEPEIEQVSVDDKAAEETAHTEKIEEANSDHKKIYDLNYDSVSRRDTAQAAYNNIDTIVNNRKKKLWLYVPLAMVVIIVFVIALPVMIKKFNTPSMPALTEFAEYDNTEKDEDIPSSNNTQMSNRDLNGPSAPSPVQNPEAGNASPAEQDNTVNLWQVSATENSKGALPPGSNIITELKSKKPEDAALPAEMSKTIKNTSQMNNANIIKPELSAGAKADPAPIENGNKIDLIAKIDEAFKDLQTIQNEKPRESEVVMMTGKTPEDKPLVKTEEQPATMHVVKLEETSAAVAVIESKRIPVVEPEVKARDAKKEDIKKAEPAVKIREMPNVALLVKRDKSRSAQNNSSNLPGVSTADLLKKWRPIGSTKSGVPLFIAPDNISYPYEHVVNLLVKASVNKKDFIDMLAINCSQIKLRILEERNGNNPVFSSYSNEWKDIIPDSMILYNSACPEKK